MDEEKTGSGVDPQKRKKRRRIIGGAVAGGILVLTGIGILLQWQKVLPATSLVGVAVAVGGGIWLMLRTFKRNAEYARNGETTRIIIPFGVAVFLILFGVGLGLASFNLVPDYIWSLGPFFIAVGAALIYRSIVTPNGDKEGE